MMLMRLTVATSGCAAIIGDEQEIATHRAVASPAHQRRVRAVKNSTVNEEMTDGTSCTIDAATIKSAHAYMRCASLALRNIRSVCEA